MLSKCQTIRLLNYWKGQLAACEMKVLEPPLRLVITVLEEVLEIKDGA